MSYEQEILRKYANEILETVSYSDVDHMEFELGKEAAGTWLKIQAEILPPNPALSDVIAERKRQIEAEGWTAGHDDSHESGDLAYAGAAYSLHAGCVLNPLDQTGFPGTPPSFWNWGFKWWKPSTPRRDLVKAAALILAEIERIDRAGKTEVS